MILLTYGYVAKISSQTLVPYGLPGYACFELTDLVKQENDHLEVNIQVSIKPDSDDQKSSGGITLIWTIFMNTYLLRPVLYSLPVRL